MTGKTFNDTASSRSDVLEEKGEINLAHVENARSTASDSVEDQYEKHYEDIDEGFDPKVIKKLVRKIDWHIIPILSAMYCISLIDRTNLSMARSVNNKAMNKELGLDKGDRYSIATMIFFIPYIILEIPSQTGLRAFGVRAWLGSATFLWGIVMMCFGFVTSWQQLAALRALLGIFESALFPGAAFLISCWYPRKSMAVRNTLFYFGASGVGGLSSILAWGISQMHGTAGKSGWRWIFILEGLMTIVIAICAYLLLNEFPDKAKFLTEEERKIVITRIQRDRGDAIPDPMTWAKLRQYALEPKAWLYGIIFCATTLASYAMSYFLPTLLQQMGFSNMESQLLYAPPKMWGIVPGLALAWWSDRTKQRAWPIAFNCVLLIIGTCMFSQLDASQKVARYAGVWLTYGSATMNVPLVIAWSQSSIRSQSKRGFTSAMLVAWGGIGGLLAGVVFIEKEAKKGYPTGIFTTIGLNALAIFLTGVLFFWYKRQNRKAEEGEVVLEGHPMFRYQA